jgi:TonB-linked SusC/RagA family outer membrane protein
MYKFYSKIFVQPPGCIVKLLLIMKLTTLLLIGSIMQVSASTFAQKVTLSEKNAPIVEVFSEIRAQTGYDFLFSATTVKTARPVNIDVRNADLNNVLKVIFEGQPLKYAIENKSVVVSKKDVETESNAVTAEDPRNTITGTVTDEDDRPMSGVTVKGLGLSSLTQTDKNGHYLTHTGSNTVLTFTFIGYKTIEVSVGDKTVINVKMHPDVKNLSEIVVIPYGTSERRLLTGSVSTVTAAEIERQPVTNVLQALEGQVPGLLITQQNGVPGSAPKVQIRGQNSILNGNDPLYIVDGVPFSSTPLGQIGGSVVSSGFLGNTVGGNSSAAGVGGLSPLNSINPEDIESITVLKDADATAIYGSRGANGVILITTKKGKAGPTTTNVSYNTGYSTPASLPVYLSTAQYLAYRQSAFKNDGVQPGINDLDLNGTWNTNSYTNWAKELIGHPSATTNAQATISGGNQQTQFLIGAGYTKMSPTYDGNFSDQRPSLHFNINNTSTNQKFKVLLSGSYSVDVNNIPGLDISNSLGLPPNAPSLHNPDGTLNWWSSSATNPYASLLETYSGTTKALQGNGVVSYQLLPSLQVRSSFGYTEQDITETRLNPAAASNPLFPTAPIPNSLDGNNSNSSWIIEPQIEYKKTISKGTLDVLLGGTFQSMLTEGETISGTGYSSDLVLDNISAATKTLLANTYDKYRYEAVFARVNYTFLDRYIINFTGRRDGSSRFGPDNQFGNFGSAGAAWIFSDESFFKESLPFLNFGKLRGSYGVVGSDQIGDYRYLDSYTAASTYTYLGQAGLAPTRLFNPHYGWESNQKLDLAADLAFFQDRIRLSADWFRDRSSNQLVSQALPPTSGNTTIQANLDATVQNTGWEFELNTVTVKSKKFTWTSDFNLSIERNKLISFPGLANSTYKTAYIIGQPVSITPGLYQMVGVNPTTGLYQYRTTTGTITSTPTGNVDNTARRNLNPTFYGAFSNSFTYQRVRLDVMFQFVKQIGQNVLYTTNSPFSSMTNVPEVYEGRIWLKPGDNASIQRLTADVATYPGLGLAAQDALQSTGSYTDASYIRLKNVSLSYALSQDWVRHVGMRQARVFAQAQNLLTITKYLGVDPESQGSVLPPLRTIVFGVQFTL